MPQHALVPNPARDPVGVHPLEQELRRLAPGADQVAEAGERDPTRRLALGDNRLPRAGVGPGGDGQSVADTDEAALLLQVAREGLVLDPDRVEAELGLQPRRFVLAHAEPGGRARPVQLGSAALEAEQRYERGGPRLRRR